MDQVAECKPSKHKALNSNPSTIITMINIYYHKCLSGCHGKEVFLSIIIFKWQHQSK
jgi:hypothetical protein